MLQLNSLQGIVIIFPDFLFQNHLLWPNLLMIWLIIHSTFHYYFDLCFFAHFLCRDHLYLIYSRPLKYRTFYSHILIFLRLFTISNYMPIGTTMMATPRVVAFVYTLPNALGVVNSVFL